MNNKGFTLVELIATIALLSIIAVISFVSINEVIDQSKVSDCENIVRNINSAVKEYVSDNRYSFNNYNSFNITANDLIVGEYLSSSVTDSSGNVVIDNPFTDEYINPNDVIIKVELNTNYTIKKIDIEQPDIFIECSIE